MMTKICFLSDTHGMHEKVEITEADIIVFAGDITNSGKLLQLDRFNYWLSCLKITKRIVVAGNHDFICEQDKYITKTILGKTCTYLEDSSTIIDGIKFYGSPWQPWYYDWAFNVKESWKREAIWAKIPQDTEILITHCPPYGIGDLTLQGDNAGCPELRKRIEQLPDLKYHVFGHIHEGNGQYSLGNIQLLNVSTCTREYKPINKPIVIEYEDKK
jgi:Icc-related predicted phosphoesterase